MLAAAPTALPAQRQRKSLGGQAIGGGASAYGASQTHSTPVDVANAASGPQNIAIQNAIGNLTSQMQMGRGLGGGGGGDGGASQALPLQLQRLDLQNQGLNVDEATANRMRGILTGGSNLDRTDYVSRVGALNQLQALARGDYRRGVGLSRGEQARGLGTQQLQQATQIAGMLGQLRGARSQAVGAGATGSEGAHATSRQFIGDIKNTKQSGLLERQGISARARNERAGFGSQLRQFLAQNTDQLSQAKTGWGRSQLNLFKGQTDINDQLAKLGFGHKDIGLQKQIAQIMAANAGGGGGANALAAWSAMNGLVGQIGNLQIQQAGLGGQTQGLAGQLGQLPQFNPGFNPVHNAPSGVGGGGAVRHYQ